MATYTFETIGAAQALAFNSSSDQLVFSTPGTSASNIRVGFGQNSEGISITSELTGRSVVFGHGFSSRGTVTFGDGTTLVLGASPQGTAGADLFIGGGRVSGGAGNDTLMGGSHHGELTGGEGHDLFIIRLPPSHEQLVPPPGLGV